MFPKSPRKRTFTSNNNQIVPLKGLFKDGVWHCSCDPRLPASYFETRKEGPNKGKWFYTCQKPQDKGGCGFFLWKTLAETREMCAIINNKRSEPEPFANLPSSKLATPSPSKRDAGNKWIKELGKTTAIVVDGDDDDDYFGEPLTQEEVEALIADNLKSPASETPRKVIKSSPFVTPGSKRKHDETYLPTPSTRGSDDIFGTPSTTRPSGRMWDGNEPFGLRSPSKTPTPIRFRDATQPLEAAGDSRIGHNLVDEVMELLKDQKIESKVKKSLRELLSKHALKHSGIVKGRDITRVALVSKDVQIADLLQKIAALEVERDMDRTVIKHFKDNMTDSLKAKGKT